MTSTTDGWVESASERRAGRGRSCSVSYRYSVDGVTHQVKTRYGGGCGDIKGGAASLVFYSPDDPEYSTLRDPRSWTQLYFGAISCFFFAAVFITFGLLPAIGEIRARRRGARGTGRQP